MALSYFNCWIKLWYKLYVVFIICSAIELCCGCLSSLLFCFLVEKALFQFFSVVISKPAERFSKMFIQSFCLFFTLEDTVFIKIFCLLKMWCNWLRGKNIHFFTKFKSKSKNSILSFIFKTVKFVKMSNLIFSICKEKVKL